MLNGLSLGLDLLKLSTVASIVFTLSFSVAISAQPAVITIDIGHAQLNANEWVSSDQINQTILALPGSGADVSRYRAIGPLLAEAGYRVIAINQRGIMGSTGELNGLTLHDYASDIARVIETLGLEKVHMMGWALGNRISRVVATDYPDKVASITLIAAGGLVKPLTEPGELGKLLGEAGLSLDEKIHLSRRTLFSPQSSDQLVREFAQDLNYWDGARASQSQANRDTPVEEWWAGGDGPMLIVQGVDDKTAPPENGIRMRDEFGERITVVNLQSAGHAMGLEKPRETVNAILPFLRKHSF